MNWCFLCLDLFCVCLLLLFSLFPLWTYLWVIFLCCSIVHLEAILPFKGILWILGNYLLSNLIFLCGIFFFDVFVFNDFILQNWTFLWSYFYVFSVSCWYRLNKSTQSSLLINPLTPGLWSYWFSSQYFVWFTFN